MLSAIIAKLLKSSDATYTVRGKSRAVFLFKNIKDPLIKIGCGPTIKDMKENNKSKMPWMFS